MSQKSILPNLYDKLVNELLDNFVKFVKDNLEEIVNNKEFDLKENFTEYLNVKNLSKIKQRESPNKKTKTAQWVSKEEYDNCEDKDKRCNYITLKGKNAKKYCFKECLEGKDKCKTHDKPEKVKKEKESITDKGEFMKNYIKDIKDTKEELNHFYTDEVDGLNDKHKLLYLNDKKNLALCHKNECLGVFKESLRKMMLRGEDKLTFDDDYEDDLREPTEDELDEIKKYKLKLKVEDKKKSSDEEEDNKKKQKFVQPKKKEKEESDNDKDSDS